MTGTQDHPRTRRWHAPACIVGMIVATLTVYCPPSLFLEINTRLYGFDYNFLHLRRIRFAQEAIFQRGELPAWYPHELMGTPFWSNIQSVPFSPTRWPLLLVPPEYGYAVGVNLMAILSALFTYLFTRRIGLSPIASAVAGWTFACAGMFAGRVWTGHLVSHEGYASIPLLLWLVERAMQVDAGRKFATGLLCIAVATACIAVAPHPQFPLYGLALATLYTIVIYRERLKRVMLTIAAMVIGGGLSAFAIYPMWMLVQRSTRLLPLDPAKNDVYFPYYRLIAFLVPGANGWPESLPGEAALFVDKNTAFFWDTVCYAGWFPIIALVTLLTVGFRRKLARPGAVVFLTIAGVVALVTALPDARRPFDAIPGTILRSPARQVYVTDFALAIVAGVGIERLMRWQRLGRDKASLWVAVGAVIAAHAVDLGSHARRFVEVETVVSDRTHDALFREKVGDGRIAMDYTIDLPINRQIDDVGFFDSIMLARSYAGLMDLAGTEPGFNNQALRGSRLIQRALRATGTRFVVSGEPRPDLPDETNGKGELRKYSIPDAHPRASFFPHSGVSRLSTDEIHRRLRDESFDIDDSIMIANDQPQAATVQSRATAPFKLLTLDWKRVSTDVMEVRGHVPAAGYVRVLETWDPGWSATVDGKSVPTVPINDMFLGVEVPPGAHVIRFEFHTPGAQTGIMLSVASAVLLSGLWFVALRNRIDQCS